jgi:hypothetical protein
MSKNKWEMWKEKNPEDALMPWDMLNPKIEKASEEVAKKRLKICMSCDRLIKSTKQCKECKCFMNLKTKLAIASCPIGKWSAEDAVN